jgi:hypothetical protein
VENYADGICGMCKHSPEVFSDLARSRNRVHSRTAADMSVRIATICDYAIWVHVANF